MTLDPRPSGPRVSYYPLLTASEEEGAVASTGEVDPTELPVTASFYEEELHNSWRVCEVCVVPARYRGYCLAPFLILPLSLLAQGLREDDEGCEV